MPDDKRPKDSRLADQKTNAETEDALSPAAERRREMSEGGHRVGNATPVDGPVTSPPAEKEK